MCICYFASTQLPVLLVYRDLLGSARAGKCHIVPCLKGNPSERGNCLSNRAKSICRLRDNYSLLATNLLAT